MTVVIREFLKGYLQIQVIPKIKISTIKNLLGSRDSFIAHSRVQSDIVWSRLSRWWHGYHQRENTKSTASDIEIRCPPILIIRSGL